MKYIVIISVSNRFEIEEMREEGWLGLKHGTWDGRDYAIGLNVEGQLLDRFFEKHPKLKERSLLFEIQKRFSSYPKNGETT